MRITLCLFGFLAVAAAPVVAQNPRLLDINTKPSGAYWPEERMAVLGGRVFYSGTAAATGVELYWSAGPNTARLLKDIHPGPDGAAPFMLTNVGGTLYFFADDGVRGFELWKSDGTTSGTVLVKDIRPGKASSLRPKYYRKDVFFSLGNTVLFAADDGVHGEELWRSDGTATGTTMVKDLLSGGQGSRILSFAKLGNRVYFAATGTNVGTELWVTDGTTAGTTVVKDIMPGAVGSHPSLMTVSGGALFFMAWSGQSIGYELWKSDGTANGTVQVKDIYSGTRSGYPSGFVPFGGGVVFSCDSPNGRELFKSNGTTAGTQLVKDIRTGTAAGLDWYSLFDRLGGHVYFAANDGNRGWELWRTDGNAAGTTLVKDILPGSGSGLAKWRPDGVVTTNYLYFAADDGATGQELWRTNGTAAGTTRVVDLLAGREGSRPRRFVALGGDAVAFVATDKNGEGVFVSLGTAATTWRIGTSSSTGSPTQPSKPVGMTDVSGTLFLTANDGVSGFELWRSNGTRAGTSRVQDIYPGAGTAIWNGDPVARGTYDLQGAVLHDELYFAAWDGPTSLGLWRSDGTAAGTRKITAFARTTYGWVFDGGAAGGQLYFTGRDSTGFGLWTSDGTAAGTRRLRSSLSGGQFRALGDEVFFHGVHSRSLTHSIWHARGQYVTHLATLPSRTNLYSVSYAQLGRRLFTISADDLGTAGLRQLTSTAATLIKPLRLSTAQINQGLLASTGGRLYFSSLSQSGATDLWSSDGTSAGSNVVRTLSTQSATVREFTAAGNQVFFVVAHRNNDHELWRSDGTVTGTRRLLHVGGLTRGRRITELTAIGSRRICFLNLGELWVSDGTTAGTQILVEGQYYANHLTLSNGRLFFQANSPVKGAELAVVRLTGVAHAFGHGCKAAGIAPRLGADDPVLGASTRISVDLAPANSGGIVLLGAATPRPVQLGSGCTLYVAANGALPIAARTNAAGTWASPAFGIPNLPVLKGVRAVAQGAFGRTATAPLGTDLSNPVVLVVGR